MSLTRFNITDLLTCTRASTAMVKDDAGVYSSVGNNVLRRSHENGSFCLLAEETRTNSTANSALGGAVVGSVFPATGGALPTGWTASPVAGSTWTVTATGTENGLPYIDVRYTATDGTTGGAVNFDPAAVILAADGQTWATSAFVRRIAGSIANLADITLRTQWTGSTGSYQSGANIASTIDSADRRVNVHTVADGTSGSGVIASARPRLTVSAASGGAVDITFRISAPQLEQGAFATSPIITDGTAATREADQIKLNDGLLAQIYGGGPVSVLEEWELEYNTAGTAFAHIWNMDAGSAADRMFSFIGETSGVHGNGINVGSAAQSVSASVAYTSGAAIKIATRFQASSFARSRNGGAVATATPASLPTGLFTLGISNNGSGTTTNPVRLLRLRKLIVYPHALTNAELEALSA